MVRENTSSKTTTSKLKDTEVEDKRDVDNVILDQDVSGQDDMEIDEPEPALTQPLQAAPPSAPSAAPSSAPSLAPSHLLQQQGPAQPVEAPAALTDAYKAVDFLTERVLGPTAAGGNWPVSSMDMRPALEKAHEELTGALNALVRDGTSCSMLVMGERGVGKTLVVERALHTVCSSHNGSAMSAGDKVVGVVRLSGLLHCEERVAFQEVARQLCSEFQQLFSAKATYDENLGFLRAMLASLHTCMKSVVFVLDDFERFARASAAPALSGTGTGGGRTGASAVAGGRAGRQMLLYNLLDVLQHSKVQAAVIGLTVAQDVMESLEKRVKSRFSHRKMVLVPSPAFEPTPVKPVSAMPAPPSRPVRGGKDKEEVVVFRDTPLGILQDMLTLPGLRPDGQLPWSATYGTSHNTAVKAALGNKGVVDALSRLYKVGLNPSALAGIARTALTAWDAELEAGPCALLPSHILAGCQASGAEDLTVHLVTDLSTLQLYLLAGMSRLEQKKVATYNFEMVWDECQSVQQGRDQLAKFGRDAAWRAFQGLLSMGVAFWVNQNAETRGRSLAYAGCCLRLTPSEVERGMQAHQTCPEVLMHFLRMEA